MMKSWWSTLTLGLAVGFVLGYLYGESQPIKPSRQPIAQRQAAGPLPEGHPPIAGASEGQSAQLALERQIADLEQRLTTDPDNVAVLVALGNLCFDTERWQEAKGWYERALELAPSNPQVTTDLAVVYRNLSEPARALELLEHSLTLDDSQWQTWYNKVVVLEIDLGRSDEAASALDRLRQLREENPSIPDLSGLEEMIRRSAAEP